jgi:hypothetical protein
MKHLLITTIAAVVLVGYNQYGAHLESPDELDPNRKDDGRKKIGDK